MGKSDSVIEQPFRAFKGENGKKFFEVDLIRVEKDGKVVVATGVRPIKKGEEELWERLFEVQKKLGEE